MSLREALKSVVQSYRTEISLVRDFASDAHGMLGSKLSKPIEPPLTDEERGQLQDLKDAFDGFIQGTEEPASKRKPRTSIHIDTTERIAGLVMQAAMPIKQQGLLAEMCLAHLVAYEEAFVKDYLYELFIRKREMLRSNVTITYERISAHRSMSSLWSAMARSEVDTLGYGSIDDVAASFNKKLNISLADYNRWPALREHSYRRNLIIHNRGRVNDIYRSKLGVKDARLHPSTNLEYIKGAAENMLGFLEFIHSQVCSKFHPRSNKTMEPTR